jgi:hypothetical protein
MWPLGWSGHAPPRAKQFFLKKKFALAIEGGRSIHPQGPWGWRRASPTDWSRVAEATPMAFRGGSTTPDGQSKLF